jgi:hypothetical protein
LFRRARSISLVDFQSFSAEASPRLADVQTEANEAARFYRRGKENLKIV